MEEINVILQSVVGPERSKDGVHLNFLDVGVINTRLLQKLENELSLSLQKILPEGKNM